MKAPKPGLLLSCSRKQAVFLIGLDGMHQAIELGAQLRHMKWLGDVIGRAKPGGFNGRLDRSVLRQHDDGNLRIIGADSLDEFKSPDLRNLQIGDHDVDGMLLEDFERLLGGRRHMNLQPRFGGHIPAKIPSGYFVVDNQET